MAKQRVRKPNQQGSDVGEDAAQKLWTLYFRQRKPKTVRDSIVEYYLRWATKTAAALARVLGLRDRENAVGEALLHFSTVVVPRFKKTPDGRGRFEDWATMCMRSRLVSLRRKQREAMLSIDARGSDDGELTLAEILPAPPERAVSEFHFGQFAAGLDDQAACLLWLRYFRGTPIKEAAETLGLTSEEAAKIQKRGILQLRKLHRVR